MDTESNLSPEEENNQKEQNGIPVDLDKIPEELLNEITEKHPELNKEAIIEISQTLARHEHYSGPIPPPMMLKEYADVYPEAPKIIFKWFEENSKSRIKNEDKQVDADISNERLGMKLGFTLMLVLIAGGTTAICFGRTGWGFATIVTSMVPIIGLFIKRRRKREDT